MVKKMKDGGGVTFDIAVKEEEEEEELLATTLERIDTEDGDDDESVDVHKGINMDEGTDKDEE